MDQIGHIGHFRRRVGHAPILIAASVNTISKAAIASIVGGAQIGTFVGGASALALAALALTFLVLP